MNDWNTDEYRQTILEMRDALNKVIENGFRYEDIPFLREMFACELDVLERIQLSD